MDAERIHERRKAEHVKARDRQVEAEVALLEAEDESKGLQVARRRAARADVVMVRAESRLRRSGLVVRRRRFIASLHVRMLCNEYREGLDKAANGLEAERVEEKFLKRMYREVGRAMSERVF